MAWIRMTGGKTTPSTKYIIKNGVLENGYTDTVDSTNATKTLTTSGGARLWRHGDVIVPNCFSIAQSIDVTNYSKLIFEATTNSTGVNPDNVPYNYKYVGLSLSNAKPTDGFIQGFAVSRTLNPINLIITTYELDISNLAGSYYFCANVNCNQTTGTLALYNVRLEK